MFTLVLRGPSLGMAFPQKPKNIRKPGVTITTHKLGPLSASACQLESYAPPQQLAVRGEALSPESLCFRPFTEPGLKGIALTAMRCLNV